MKKSVFFLVAFLVFQTGFSKDGQIQFIENKNQWESQIAFKADLPGGALFLTPNKLVYNFYSATRLHDLHEKKHTSYGKKVYQDMVNYHAYSVEMVGANPIPAYQRSQKASHHHNYFIGNNPSKWASNVPVYGGIQYTEVYPGIDLSLYSKESNLKYDFIVQANADPSKIQLRFDGVSPIVKSNGNLFIKTSVNEINELKPYSYQLIDGKQVEVPCAFQMKNNVLSYSFPQGYNKQYELVIDPVMVFMTYSGSSATTYGWSACYDNLGNLYSGGECFGTGWPVTTGAFQMAFGGNIDASINKYSPDGALLLYSTYYGGSAFDVPNSLVVNSNLELVICGESASTNLATTPGCFDNTSNGSNDIFVAHFNVAGTALIGASYVGGSGDDGAYNHEVNFDNNNDIIVASTSSSTNFPTTPGCFQSTNNGGFYDGIFFKINPTCTNLLFSSYLGGTAADECKSIRQNSVGEYVIAGYTSSGNFPTTPGTVHPTAQGNEDGFLCVFASNGNTMTAGTFLGTTDAERAYRLQIDPANNNIYVCGTGEQYPISAGVYSNAGGNIYIDRLNPTLTVSQLSTRIGGTNAASPSFLSPAAFLLDECKNIYVSCLGAGFSSATLPLSPNAYQTTQGGFWLCVLYPDYANLLYATYMGSAGDHIDGGSSRFDPSGIVYQSVCTSSPTAYQFPTSYSPTKQSGSWDVASFKFDFEAGGVNSVAATASNDSVCAPGIIFFQNNSVGATSFLWDFGDGNTSTQVAPQHQYMAQGTYTVTLYAYNPSLCITEDTSYLEVHIFDLQIPQVNVKDTVFCDPNAPRQLSAVVANYHPGMSVRWEPIAGVLSGGNTLNPIVDPLVSTIYTVYVTDSIGVICKETGIGVLTLSEGDTTKFLVNPVDTTVCPGEKVTFTASGGIDYLWSPNALISDITQPIVEVTIFNEMWYSVDMVDQYGCKGKKWVHVNTFPPLLVDAGPEDIIRYGDGINLNATGGTNFIWDYDPTLSDPTIPNPWVNPKTETTYYVTGLDNHGCKAKDSVKIHVSNAVIPNAFSPNGDGKNDIFKFVPSSHLTALKSLRLYDRWGTEVFYTDEAIKGWNGKYKGKEMDMGTYFYLCEYSIGGKGYIEKGDFTLVR